MKDGDILGHECAGIIEKVGSGAYHVVGQESELMSPGVSEVKVGDVSKRPRAFWPELIV